MHLRTGAFLLLWLVAASAPAAEVDGPYVFRTASGIEAHVVETDESGSRDRRVAPDARGAVTVAAVGAVPAFKVRIRAAATAAPDAIAPGAKAPMFVVADTHGEYEILVAMLQRHHVLGPALEWTFGKGHLVLLGDVFDRGPNQVEILWLIYTLEAEARRAGGGAHLVLGNHESMALRGDGRYLQPKYPRSAQVLGRASYAELFDAASVLGQWLRTRATVLRCGAFLCLHAGVSRAVLDRGLTLAQINATVRAVLSGAESPQPGSDAELLMGTLGPQWYRGYFPEHRDFPPASAEDVERTLGAFGVRRIFVGHTIVPAIDELFGGKVIAVQVYPKREGATTTFEALLVKRGALFRARPDGGVEPLP